MTTATRGRRTRTGDLDEPLRAVIYVRQSAAKEETISLEEQEHACREYCATKGYRVVDVATEQITGRLWSRRPEMQRAMRLIEDGTANVLVIRKWNRISRRNLHWFQAEYQVEQAGGRIESALEQVDATTAVGRFARNSMINAGELQSELIADEWRATHAHRRRAGLPPTGGRKYGYRRGRAGGPGGPERYEPDPDQADVLRWMYQEYLAGAGHLGIARELNRRGVPRPTNARWSQKAVERILDGGFAAGVLAVGRATTDDARRPVWIPWPEREWIDGAHEPIITPATWAAYRQARTARQSDAPRTRAPSHPLSGLLVCGDCGAGMIRKPYKQRNTVALACRVACREGARLVRYVSIEERSAHTQVRAWLAGYAAAIDAAAGAGNPVAAPTAGAGAAAAADRRITEIDGELVRLTRHLIAERIAESEYDAVRAELIRERAEMHAVIAAASAEDAADVPDAAVVRGLAEEWPTLPPLRAREILRSLADAVIVVPPPVRRGRAMIRVVPRWTPVVE